MAARWCRTSIATTSVTCSSRRKSRPKSCSGSSAAQISSARSKLGRMRTAAVVLLVAAACGKGSGDDWTKRPVKTQSATVKGVAFTIDLPDGMRKKEEPDEVRWDFLVDGYAKTPEVSVSATGWADSLDKYLETEKDVTNWLRKDSLPDGYVVSYENSSYKGKEDYLIYVYKKTGDKVLTCHARVTPWTKGASTKDKVPAVEKMCL